MWKRILLSAPFLFISWCAAAQSILPGFPPGVFLSREAIDGAVTPVALDAAGSATQYTATATPSYTGLTVGAGSHRALVCAVGTDLSAGIDPATATWDSGGTNQAMTNFAELGDGVNSIKIILFGLVAPTSGNKTLAVTFNTPSTAYISCIAFINVLQTGSTTTFFNSQTVSSGAATPVAITTTGTASSDASAAALMCASGVHRTATTGTSWYANSTGPGGNSYGDYLLSVGSISDTLDGAKICVMAALTLKAG